MHLLWENEKDLQLVTPYSKCTMAMSNDFSSQQVQRIKTRRRSAHVTNGRNWWEHEQAKVIFLVLGRKKSLPYLLAHWAHGIE